MSTLQFLRVYCDEDGDRTVGISEGGPFEISGRIAPWIRGVASTMLDGRELSDLTDTLDPERAEYVRGVVDALTSVGAVRESAAPGPITFVHDTSGLLRDAVAGSSLPLAEAVLGTGPLRGEWLEEILEQPGDRTVGLVLLAGAAALVVGPAPAAEVADVVRTLRLERLTDDEPDPATQIIAAGQLVRGVARPAREAWSGTRVTPDGTTTWRLRPHPWATGTAPLVDGDLDRRAMAVIDPLVGTIRAVEEGDLPQVPRQMSAATLAGRGVEHGVDHDREVTVHADGASYEDARRRVVLRALGRHAAQCVDQRRPFVPARRLLTSEVLVIPVDRAFDGPDGELDGCGTACAEARDDALVAALLAAAELGLPDLTGPVALGEDGSLPEAAAASADLVRRSDPQAWWGWLDGDGPPRAVAVTRHGTAHAAGRDHAEAAGTALERALLAEQVLAAGRPDLLPACWVDARPAAPAYRPLPEAPPLTTSQLESAVARLHPEAVVVDLDHDPDLQQLGFFVVRVVTEP